MPLSVDRIDDLLASREATRVEYRLRRLTLDDAVALVPLNDAAYPAVPHTSLDDMRSLLGLADVAVGAERDGSLVGFALTLGDGVPYASENYRFFHDRGVSCRYVDRIVIAEPERGQGLGALLYGVIFDVARAEGRLEVTCEVNLDPPNPGSLAFHQRLGFRSVGTQITKGATVTVSLLAAPVSAGAVDSVTDASS